MRADRRNLWPCGRRRRRPRRRGRVRIDGDRLGHHLLAPVAIGEEQHVEPRPGVADEGGHPTVSSAEQAGAAEAPSIGLDRSASRIEFRPDDAAHLGGARQDPVGVGGQHTGEVPRWTLRSAGDGVRAAGQHHRRGGEKCCGAWLEMLNRDACEECANVVDEQLRLFVGAKCPPQAYRSSA